MRHSSSQPRAPRKKTHSAFIFSSISKNQHNFRTDFFFRSCKKIVLLSWALLKKKKRNFVAFYWISCILCPTSLPISQPILRSKCVRARQRRFKNVCFVATIQKARGKNVCRVFFLEKGTIYKLLHSKCQRILLPIFLRACLFGCISFIFCWMTTRSPCKN